MPQDRYNFDFNVDGNKYTKAHKHLAAFHQASDIRKFEIEMYWKRAAYFWTLITVTFAGYFTILSSSIHARNYFALMLACIGFVFTFAWYLSGRGSKFWQENWENHLDLLEDDITGPLYKTTLRRPCLQGPIEKIITGPLGVSVSKINQWVSFFVLIIWMMIIAITFILNIDSSLSMTIEKKVLSHLGKSYLCMMPIALAIITCVMMFKYSKTFKKKHKSIARKRTTSIIMYEKEEQE